MVGIAILDSGLRVLAANESFTGYLGPTAHGPEDRRFPDLIAARQRSELVSGFGQLAEGQVRTLEGRVSAHPAQGRPQGEFVVHAEAFETAANRIILVTVRPAPVSDRAGDAGAGTGRLTRLDALILEGAAAGLSTVQLAGRLFLSRQGVEYHVGVLLRRFRVPNRTALASKAYAMGIFDEGSWPPRVLPECIIKSG